MLKQIALSALAVATLAVPAKAFEEPGEYLYLIGESTGWDINQTNCVLHRSGSGGHYYGIIPAKNGSVFRFYTALGDWEDNSIGFIEEDMPTEFNLTQEITTHFVEGKGSWQFTGNEDCMCYVHVDFVFGEVTFIPISPVSYSYTAGFSGEDGTVLFDPIPSEFFVNVTFSNGMVEQYGCLVHYTAEGISYDQQYLDPFAKWGNIEIGISDYPIQTQSGSVDIYTALTPNLLDNKIAYRMVRDTSNIKFQFKNFNEELPADHYIDIRSQLLYDDDVNPDNIDVTIIAGNAKKVSTGVFYIPADSEGEITVKVTSTEVPDRELVRTYTVLPAMPEYLLMYDVSSYNPGEKEFQAFDYRFDFNPETNCYEGTFKTFTRSMWFVLGGPEYFVENGFYIYTPSYDNIIDLTQPVATSYFMSGDSGMLFEIQGATSIKTYQMRIFPDSHMIQIFEQGFDPEKYDFTPAETNPTYLSKNRNNRFVFTYDRQGNFEARIDGQTASWCNTYIDWTNNQIISDIYCPEYEDASTIHFSIVNLESEAEIYSLDLDVQYVALESVKLPEAITLHPGEYYTLLPEIEPADASENFSFWLEEEGFIRRYEFLDENSCQGVDILAKAEGSTLLHIMKYDWSEEYASVIINVIPAEATVGEHIFHATVNIGEELHLNLSAHHTSDFADAKWTSSNEEVATVDSEGNVYAVGAGSVLITADCGEHQAVMGVKVSDDSSVADVETAATVTAYGYDGAIYVRGAREGQDIKVYDVKGNVVGQTTGNGSVAKINVEKGVHIVAVEGQMFKLAL